jgi:hypothetical protein
MERKVRQGADETHDVREAAGSACLQAIDEARRDDSGTT